MTKTDRYLPIWTLNYQNGPLFANVDPNWPKWTVICQFGPKMTKIDRNMPNWTQNDQNGPWFAHSDPKWPKRTVIGHFGPEMTKKVRDWSIWAQNDQNAPWLVEMTKTDGNLAISTQNDQDGSLFANLDPQWLKWAVVGSKLANHGPFRSFWVRIEQSRSVLVILGPNWQITVRFGHFGSKLTNHGLFWSFWV